MKALVLQEKNKYPNLILDKNKPKSKLEHVEIKINAAGINHRDLWIAKGMYPGIKLNTILGSDASGTYKDKDIIINPGINWGTSESFQGEHFEVLGMPSDGTFTEHLSIPQVYVHDKPSHLSYVEAAGLPLAGVTAYRALMTKAKPNQTDKVFISGIGGGVSLFAFQYAIALGCEVYVSSSSQDKIDKAISLGAAGGVNYRNIDFAKELLKISGGIDVIIDSAGGDGFASLVYACNPGARMVFYGGTRGKINQLNPQLIFWRQIHIMGSTMGSPLDFKNMLSFVNQHQITPIIDNIYSLKNKDKAFDRMNEGKQFGKIVFDMTLSD